MSMYHQSLAQQCQNILFVFLLLNLAFDKLERIRDRSNIDLPQLEIFESFIYQYMKAAMLDDYISFDEIFCAMKTKVHFK